MSRQSLPGSSRPSPHVSHLQPDDSPDERLRVSVYLRPATPVDPEALIAQAALPPPARRYLGREELTARHAAASEDVAAVTDFAEAHGLRVVISDPARRRVELEGGAGELAAAFGISWARARHHDGSTHRLPVGELTLPTRLASRVVGVLGLDRRPKFEPHVRCDPMAAPSPSTLGGFRIPDLASVYGFPHGSGKGVRVGLIELGGGYARADLETFFDALGLPIPRIRNVSVGGAQNDPIRCRPQDRQEVTLDLQVLGALAPDAELAVYFAGNQDQDFMGALQAALHDPEGPPSILSISWGSAEAAWGPLDYLLFSDVLQQAAAQGMTIVCSSGDTGARDGLADGKAHVNYPASSAWVLGCGGTTLSLEDGIPRERVWFEADFPGVGNIGTGGGISDLEDLPSWQASAGVPLSAEGGRVGRGVPDLSAVADFRTGYQVHVDGTWQVLGGTSAAAPLWAALLARCSEALGAPCGFLNPYLYGHPAALEAFRPVTQGNNGIYPAGPGYDCCTGLGTPDGVKLLEALRG